MNEEVKVQDASASDKAKLAVAVAMVVAGLVGYYALSGQPAWQRWLAMVAGLVLAVVAFAWSQYGRGVWQYVLDSRVELRKIVWPNRQETLTTTAIVFVFVIVSGLFFWVLDLILAWATRALSGQGGV